MIRALLLGILAFLLVVALPAQTYTISTIAGGIPPATPAVAATASIGDPPRVALDSAGNTYFAGLHSIFKVDTTGTLLRIAGTGRAGLTGDGGSALAAQVQDPVGVAVDAAGNVYFAERAAGLVRRISPSGTISTFASGLSTPMGLAVDSVGAVYVAEMGANRIRRIAPNGDSSVIAGNGAADFAGDGGKAADAALNGPEGVALDAAGTLYIADTFNHRVRAVASDGTISTFAGNGFPGFAGDDGKPSSASIILPTDVATSAGVVYIADLGNSRIRKVADGVITTIAGNSGGVQPVDGLPATGARFSGPTGVAAANGAVYLAEGSIGSGSGLDGGIFKIWKVGADGVLATVAGTGARSFSGDTGPAALAQFDSPAGIALDGKGNIYVADTRNNRVRKIAADGTVTTVAGNALAGYSGDGGQATVAQLNRPSGVAVDAAGNLFIADTGNNRVREVFPTGVIGTLAGNGNTAFYGDGLVGYQAALNHPEGVAVDENGAVYIADTGNHRIRRVVSGVIDTVQDGFDTPSSVAVGFGTTAVADRGTGTVYLRGPVMRAIALPDARGVAIDPSRAVVYATGDNRVIQITDKGPAATLVGTGQCCYAGDGGPAGAALLNAPWGIVADPSGNLYVADTGNNAIRLATASASTFFIRAVANSASNEAGPAAPGEVVTIYGAGLGPQNLVAPPQPAAGAVLPADIAGTSVTFNGIPAPLLYASAGQVSAIVPYGVTGPTAKVVVKTANVSTDAFPLTIAPSAPGIFTADSTGTGLARAFNADGAPNDSSFRAAVVGTTLTFYATGEGQTSPSGVDGKIASDRGPAPVLPVRVTIGGVDATVVSAAGAPGLPAGVMQVSVTVPAGVTGRVPLVLTVGGVPSQDGVTVFIE